MTRLSTRSITTNPPKTPTGPPASASPSTPRKKLPSSPDPTNPNSPWKPSPQQIKAAEGGHLTDVLAENLRILFIGINPSLYSAAIGRHFGRPGNRFYPALHASALTPTLLSPFDSHTLPEYGLGLTDVVDRATNAESKLSIPEKRAGIAKLREKIVRFRPRVVAFVGMDTFRHAFNLPKCTVGLQSGSLGGAAVWVLPSTSGLNANHQLKDLAVLFGELKKLAFSDEKLELGPELVEGGIEVKEEEEVEGTAEGGEPRSVSGKGKRKSPSSPKTPSKQRKIVDLGSPLEGKSAVIEELLVEDEPAEEPDRPLETPVKRKRVSMGIAA